MNFSTILFAIVVTLSGYASAGYLHRGSASSYSNIVEHVKPHHHNYHDQHYVEQAEYAHGYDAGYGHEHGHDLVKHEPDSYPKYHFSYGVKDTHTGDVKDQWEERDGDQVKGAYTMKEADGTTRIVEYTADDKNGFRAVVKNVGHAHHTYNDHKGDHDHAQVNNHGHYSHGYGHGHAGSYV